MQGKQKPHKSHLDLFHEQSKHKFCEIHFRYVINYTSPSMRLVPANLSTTTSNYAESYLIQLHQLHFLHLNRSMQKLVWSLKNINALS